MIDHPNRAAAVALLAPPPVVAEAVPEWEVEQEILQPRPAAKPSQPAPMDKVWASIANVASTITKLSASMRADRDRVVALERRIAELEASRQTDLERRLAALEAKGATDEGTP